MTAWFPLGRPGRHFKQDGRAGAGYGKVGVGWGEKRAGVGGESVCSPYHPHPMWGCSCLHGDLVPDMGTP